MIDVRWPQRHYASSSGWAGRRLLQRQLARSDGTAEVRQSGELGLVYRSARAFPLTPPGNSDAAAGFAAAAATEQSLLATPVSAARSERQGAAASFDSMPVVAATRGAPQAHFADPRRSVVAALSRRPGSDEHSVTLLAAGSAGPIATAARPGGRPSRLAEEGGSSLRAEAALSGAVLAGRLARRQAPGVIDVYRSSESARRAAGWVGPTLPLLNPILARYRTDHETGSGVSPYRAAAAFPAAPHNRAVASALATAPAGIHPVANPPSANDDRQAASLPSLKAELGSEAAAAESISVGLREPALATRTTLPLAQPLQSLPGATTMRVRRRALPSPEGATRTSAGDSQPLAPPSRPSALEAPLDGVAADVMPAGRPALAANRFPGDGQSSAAHAGSPPIADRASASDLALPTLSAAARATSSLALAPSAMPFPAARPALSPLPLPGNSRQLDRESVVIGRSAPAQRVASNEQSLAAIATPLHSAAPAGGNPFEASDPTPPPGSADLLTAPATSLARDRGETADAGLAAASGTELPSSMALGKRTPARQIAPAETRMPGRTALTALWAASTVAQPLSDMVWQQTTVDSPATAPPIAETWVAAKAAPAQRLPSNGQPLAAVAAPLHRTAAAAGNPFAASDRTPPTHATSLTVQRSQSADAADTEPPGSMPLGKPTPARQIATAQTRMPAQPLLTALPAASTVAHPLSEMVWRKTRVDSPASAASFAETGQLSERAEASTASAYSADGGQSASAEDAPPGAFSPGSHAPSSVARLDWEQLITQVSRRIFRQLTIERERRGLQR